MRERRWAAAGLALLACACVGAGDRGSAPDSERPNARRNAERVGLNLGAQLFADFRTELRVDGPAGLGTSFELEDLLGFDKQTQAFRADGFFRWCDRHRLDLSYFGFGRKSSRNLDTQIDIDGTVIPINTNLEAAVRTDVLKAAYRYDFLMRDRARLGASVGAHTMRLSARFTADGAGVDESAEAVAPLPVFGLHGSYALTDRLHALGSAEYFQLVIDQVGGGLIDLRTSLEYDLWDHVGVGVGYNFFRLGLELDADNWRGRVRYDYHGVLGFLRFGF